MTCSIAWCSFTWEAFATLVTGLAAVVAAFVLGRTQIAIQKKQTDIQEQTLQADLFERRYKVFQVAEQLLSEINREAGDPSRETKRNFAIAMGEAKFLFGTQVYEAMDEIWRKMSDLHLAQTKIPIEDGDPVNWFYDRSITLPDVFVELKLGGVLLRR